MAKASTKVEDKKTITIEISIKKWQKMALLSIVLLIASYMMISCAHAQGVSVTSCSSATGTCYPVSGVTTVASPSVSSDVNIYHATIGSATISTLMVGSCVYIDGSPCTPKKEDNKELKQVIAGARIVWYVITSFVLLGLAVFLGIGAFFTWYDSEK